MGFVYLIKDTDKETYKIGVTKNMNHRISRLQNGNSSKLEILEIIEYKYPYRLEKMLHQNFKTKNILNEWYNLDYDDVKNFKDTCNILIERINVLLNNPFFTKGIK